MAFTCSLLVEDRIAKITLTGELDAASAGGFRDRIAEAATQNPRALVLMMENLDYMASAGLRTLIFAKQKMGAGGRHLRHWRPGVHHRNARNDRLPEQRHLAGHLRDRHH